MKKSIAFIMLMFVSQVALGDFLWPRGNDFRVQVQDISIYTDGEFDTAESNEARKEKLGAVGVLFINNQRTILRLAIEDEGVSEDALICSKTSGFFECETEDADDKLTAHLEVNLKRLTGLKLKIKSTDWQGRPIQGTMQLSIL